MRTSLVKYITYGQLTFVACLLICVLILPQGLSANDGFSYYGTHKQTAFLSTIGLLALGWSYLKASRLLPKTAEALPVIYAAYIILAFLIICVVTPFKLGAGFHWIHVAATIVIFSAQMGLALWLLLIKTDQMLFLLAAILIAEALVTLISLHPTQGFLMQGEVAFQVTFAALFARGASGLILENGNITKGSN